MKPTSALTVLSAVAVVAACSSAATRSGFEADPNDVDSGTSAPPIPSKDAGVPKSCATAQAAAIKPPVDVIVIVDQSGSMSEELVSVKADVNKLSMILGSTGIDYRVVMIGSVGTSTYEVCVPPPLGGPSCASNGNIFRAVNAHVESNDALSIILSTVDATSGPTMWRDFLRPEALKIFIPVTDDNALGTTAAQFDAALLTKGPFGDDMKRNYVFYPIIGANAFPSESTCPSAVNNGSVYLDLTKMTGGKWFPVCTAAFASVFAEIGKTVAAGLSCELAIPEPENGGTLDPTRINVKVTSPDGKTTTTIVQDTSAGCEAGANGWQYSADGKKVLLCGAACDDVRADPNAKVNIEFGCQTQVK